MRGQKSPGFPVALHITGASENLTAQGTGSIALRRILAGDSHAANHAGEILTGVRFFAYSCKSGARKPESNICTWELWVRIACLSWPAGIKFSA